MKTVVCIGGGRFGTQAAIEARDLGARVLVIDPDENCSARKVAATATTDPRSVLNAKDGEVLFLPGEGVTVLLDILEGWGPDLVVPAMRGHLAALLAVEHARRRGRRLAPAPDLLSEVVGKLPTSSVRVADEVNGVAVVSYMEEGGLCVEGCDQPPVCPVTGASKPSPMRDLIASALCRSVDRDAVLTSIDLGTVGGIAGEDLRTMLAQLVTSEEGATWGIATACRCHGVINLLRTGATLSRS